MTLFHCTLSTLLGSVHLHSTRFGLFSQQHCFPPRRGWSCQSKVARESLDITSRAVWITIETFFFFFLSLFTHLCQLASESGCQQGDLTHLLVAGPCVERPLQSFMRHHTTRCLTIFLVCFPGDRNDAQLLLPDTLFYHFFKWQV